MWNLLLKRSSTEHISLTDLRVRPTFISAVSEGAGAADGPWAFFQGVCAAAQRVTLSVQVKGVLSRDTVGSAHAAAAWGKVILADVCGAHYKEETNDKISVIFEYMQKTSRKRLVLMNHNTNLFQMF